jgi:hypothetical protein
MHALTKQCRFMAIGVLIIQFGMAQETIIAPDLSKIADANVWGIYNREVKLIKENNQGVIYLDAKSEDGLVWLKNVEFTNGIIEADIKGKDLPGQSFVGIAFRGVDEKTYDAVYFRPFNFKSDDSVRKGHSVQYISHPDYPWHRLRQEHPEKYENPVNPAPDPDSFFHAKIVIGKPKINVYINDAEEPCLVVEEISDREGGWIGFWTGNNSDGAFANLKIIPVKK